MRKALFALGYRYRKNDRRLPGTPDIVLPKFHAVVFVHGCFWHGHPGCTNARIPKSHVEYWLPKLAANRERDERKQSQLERDGWRVIVVWECEVKNNLPAVIEGLARSLT